MASTRAAAPLVGVTCGAVLRNDNLPYFGLNRQYVAALNAAGARVLLLPSGDPATALGMLDVVDGILFPGGLDVDPALYGRQPEPGLGRTDAELDALEAPLARAAVEMGKPVLGICRGHQLVNVALGGTLHQDIHQDGVTREPHWTDAALGRDRLCHPIVAEPGSRLDRITGGQVEVNSFHHQAVRDVAPGLRVTAWSPDGVVEALESPGGEVVTVQCHPESLGAHPWARRLFADFVERASAGRRSHDPGATAVLNTV